MIKTDEDAFICDMAQIYHIFDWRSLPVDLVATLAAGFPDDSRINLIRANSKIDLQTALIAKLVDQTAWLVWAQTEDGHKGINRPKSVLEALVAEKKPSEKLKAFNSTEEFDAWRNKWLKQS